MSKRGDSLAVISPPHPPFCDVALPVPIDQLFRYRIPDTLQGSVQPGARVYAPFGSRRLTAVVISLGYEPPPRQTQMLLQLLDRQPVLDQNLLRLGRWIAEYYCAPLGEVLKGMLPLGGELRRQVLYSITTLGRDVAQQLPVAASDPTTTLLRLLEPRRRSFESLHAKVPEAKPVLKEMAARGWVEAEQVQTGRELVRASGDRLQVEFAARPSGQLKLSKAEREVLAYLELHPGPHALSEIGKAVRGGAPAARRLARGGQWIRLEPQRLAVPPGFERPAPVLNADQQRAVDAISKALEAKAFTTFLLQGVTGSGKTEVYMRAIEVALALHRTALLLVPEIALTPAVAGQFFHRFGPQTAILHSAFSNAERAHQWRRIREGQARVIIGTRSGVFAPIDNLGLVIIDEEHDGSYKQGETPRYHGRDVALVRAREQGAVALLGSATPSVETRWNADNGKYTLLRLPQRIGHRPMPDVEIVDMRTEFLETKRQSTFSRRLMTALEERVAKGQQSMLLLNRRGFSSFMLCRACGDRLLCTNCSVALTHHRLDRRMLCHYCGYAEPIPTQCPACGSDHIQFLGAGSERVEDELQTKLPAARIARLDRDSASTKGAYEHILQTFRAGELDILVGTQMIAKGHDIPNVTLVGVVLADIGLSLPDFRAAERSFQLLTQAAGRAGRGGLPGLVIIQTLNPDHYAVQMAAAQDYESFYKRELEYRRWLRYPPYAAFCSIVVRHRSQPEALRMATELGRELTPAPVGIKLLGPAEAPVLRVKDEYRYQLLLKAASRTLLRSNVNRLRAYATEAAWPAASMMVDVDPVSLL